MCEERNGVLYVSVVSRTEKPMKGKEKKMGTKVLEMPCITCPMSCHLQVTMNEKGDIISVSGNTCRRGETYAKAELTNPVRMLTSTVQITGGKQKRLPVMTKEAIPKALLMDAMKQIHATKVCAPVKENDIIIENVCNTGIDVVASRSIDVIP